MHLMQHISQGRSIRHIIILLYVSVSHLHLIVNSNDDYSLHYCFLVRKYQFGLIEGGTLPELLLRRYVGSCILNWHTKQEKKKLLLIIKTAVFCSALTKLIVRPIFYRTCGTSIEQLLLAFNCCSCRLLYVAICPSYLVPPNHSPFHVTW